MISFEEAAIAFAKQLMRAEQTEARLKEVEAELAQYKQAGQIKEPIKDSK